MHATMPSPATAAVQRDLDLFLEQELPPAMKNFPIWWLAKFWHTTIHHVHNLIESGALKCPIDLRNTGSSRAMKRVPRPFVVQFIQERKDGRAVAEESPQPRPRQPRKRLAPHAAKGGRR